MPPGLFQLEVLVVSMLLSAPCTSASHLTAFTQRELTTGGGVQLLLITSMLMPKTPRRICLPPTRVASHLPVQHHWQSLCNMHAWFISGTLWVGGHIHPVREGTQGDSVGSESREISQTSAPFNLGT